MDQKDIHYMFFETNVVKHNRWSVFIGIMVLFIYLLDRTESVFLVFVPGVSERCWRVRACVITVYFWLCSSHMLFSATLMQRWCAYVRACVCVCVRVCVWSETVCLV